MDIIMKAIGLVFAVSMVIVVILAAIWLIVIEYKLIKEAIEKPLHELLKRHR